MHQDDLQVRVSSVLFVLGFTCQVIVFFQGSLGSPQITVKNTEASIGSSFSEGRLNKSDFLSIICDGLRMWLRQSFFGGESIFY